jgi:dienelactone hydrolase
MRSLAALALLAFIGVEASAGPGCRVTRLELNLPSQREARFPIRIYTPNTQNAGLFPVVILLPSIHGQLITDRVAAGTLCGQGAAAIIVDAAGDLTGELMKSTPARPPALQEHDDLARRSLESVKVTLDFIRRTPGLDRRRVGLFGMSLGGMLALLNASAYSERIRAVAIVASAADLPSTLARSSYKPIRKLREARMQAWGLADEAAYARLLASGLRYNPERRLRQIDVPVRMTIAERDVTVPTDLQERLWEQLGRPEVERIDSNHAWTLVWASSLHMKRVMDFFQRNFLLDALN